MWLSSDPDSEPGSGHVTPLALLPVCAPSEFPLPCLHPNNDSRLAKCNFNPRRGGTTLKRFEGENNAEEKYASCPVCRERTAHVQLIDARPGSRTRGAKCFYCRRAREWHYG